LPETETPARPKRRILSRVALCAWLGYWVFLFVVMHMSRPPGLRLVERLGDKVVHAAAYFVLAAVGGLVIRLQGRPTNRRWLSRWVIVYVVYAAGDEVLQHFIVGRSCQATDWLADVIGASLALLLLYALSSTERRRTTISGAKRD
jgi:VanZ family protein